jgi:antitoxin component HigA of HigAB toxin-antitoxin module
MKKSPTRAGELVGKGRKRTPEETQFMLMPVFGQRSHVHEALNGKRPISATQARKLGKLFNVDDGLFL